MKQKKPAEKHAPRKVTAKSQSSSQVRETIRIAEGLIAQGKLMDAMASLNNAQKLDPRNPYIIAILERIGKLREESQPGGDAPGGDENGRQQEVSWKPSVAREVTELDLQVRALTSLADEYLSSGKVEDAFDTLMSAYLLDPMNGLVMDCEERVLPLWNKAHPLQAGSERAPAVQFPNASRLEQLQRDGDRLRREQELWRQASRLSQR